MRARIMIFAKVSLISITLLACQFVSGQKLPTDRNDLLNLSNRNQDMLVRYLLPMLKSTGGRLYVHSTCLGDSGQLLFFPRIGWNSGPKGITGLAAVRNGLAKNNEVTVAESQAGLTGIWIGDVSKDLLSTHINVLKLSPRQQYNYYDAIEAIIGTKEVQTKMRQLKMDEFTYFVHYPIQEPDPKLHHLPDSMSNLTMDEALDRVAIEFVGLVTYVECRGQNPTGWFAVSFDPLAKSPFKDARSH
jgi:hypothetical protein